MTPAVLDWSLSRSWRGIVLGKAVAAVVICRRPGPALPVERILSGPHRRRR